MNVDWNAVENAGLRKQVQELLAREQQDVALIQELTKIADDWFRAPVDDEEMARRIKWFSQKGWRRVHQNQTIIPWSQWGDPHE